MVKNKLIKMTIILTIGGLFTKLLGVIIKIFLTRTIGEYGMGIYSLIMPTFMLLYNIAMLCLPTSLNVLISRGTHNNKNLIATATFISLSIDTIIFILLFFFHKYLGIYMLNEKNTILPLFSIAFVLPFISISNILRSYIFAKEKVIIHVITNIIEDLIKLSLIIFILPKVLIYGISITVSFVMLTNIVCELSSIIIFLIVLPKFRATKKDLKPNIKNIKDILSIALPTTGSKLIGTIGYFLEPIILTKSLLSVGYTNSFIINEYGVINGYVMQIVLLPSFFTLALSQAIIPSLSKAYEKRKYNYIKQKVRQAIFISLAIGIPFTIIFIIAPNFLLEILFNTNKGTSYIRVLAPICLLHYIQSILSSALQAIDKSKVLMTSTLVGTILRSISLFIFSRLKIGMYSLIIATSINIIFVTLHNAFKLKYFFHKEKDHFELC